MKPLSASTSPQTLEMIYKLATAETSEKEILLTMNGVAVKNPMTKTESGDEPNILFKSRARKALLLFDDVAVK